MLYYYTTIGSLYIVAAFCHESAAADPRRYPVVLHTYCYDLETSPLCFSLPACSSLHASLTCHGLFLLRPPTSQPRRVPSAVRKPASAVPMPTRRSVTGIRSAIRRSSCPPRYHFFFTDAYTVEVVYFNGVLAHVWPTGVRESSSLFTRRRPVHAWCFYTHIPQVTTALFSASNALRILR